MQEKILQLKEEALSAISNCFSSDSLNEIKVKYTGKNGLLTALMKDIKNQPAEIRSQVGKWSNDARVQIEERLTAREAEIIAAETQKRIREEYVDISMPSKKVEYGTAHPLTVVKNLIIDAFASLGFKLSDGPEVELDYFNFQALNIPKDHPARDMQDTFYITDNVVLRTHTSPTQIHVMQKAKPPIRILSHGKVYRPDDDATHSPMFHQIEGLAVDKNLTLCDLKGVLDHFAKFIFDKTTKTRFRPSYFPFTEPSVEVDVSCAMCGGKGCRLCKGTGWIEVLGAGMVNRKVLSNCGIDPDKYKGFAFGIGIERITMIKYQIPDMRLLFENDLRFLTQFKRER